MVLSLADRETALEGDLARWTGDDPGRLAVSQTIRALAGAIREIAAVLARGPLAGALGQATGKRGLTDEQKALDILANDSIVKALKGSAAAALVSEEMPEPLVLAPGGSLLVTVDPIDGSSNIESNAAVGTIFSILPAAVALGPNQVLPAGRLQKAAGFALYGPAVQLVLTFGAGTAIYTLDMSERTPGATGFRRTTARAVIPASAAEFAINLSNYRHWSPAIRHYVEDCLRGRDGPRGRDYNMRWTASPVAEFMRILTRGGVFLYPGDARPGYGAGRLRLAYEANPFAFIVEQAGGLATDGQHAILDRLPGSLHEHVPMVAGSAEEVQLIGRLIAAPPGPGERSPLFSSRGLLRM